MLDGLKDRLQVIVRARRFFPGAASDDHKLGEVGGVVAAITRQQTAGVRHGLDLMHGTFVDSRRDVIAALRAFSRGKRLAGISLRALIDAERRFRIEVRARRVYHVVRVL